VTETKTVFK